MQLPVHHRRMVWSIEPDHKSANSIFERVQKWICGSRLLYSKICGFPRGFDSPRIKDSNSHYCHNSSRCCQLSVNVYRESRYARKRPVSLPFSASAKQLSVCPGNSRVKQPLYKSHSDRNDRLADSSERFCSDGSAAINIRCVAPHHTRASTGARVGPVSLIASQTSMLEHRRTFSALPGQ